MRIKTITSESGNDFSAIMVCVHCQQTQKLTSGYHDAYYHTKVIPAMTCLSCLKNRVGVVPEKANANGMVHVGQVTP